MDIQNLPRDPFTELVGLAYDHLSATLVHAHLDVHPKHHQPHGIVHGGVYATIVEVSASLGASLNSSEPDTMIVGVSNSTEFLRTHRSGRLDVVAKPVEADGEYPCWLVEIRRASDGQTVALGRVRLARVRSPTALAAPT